MNRFVTTVLLLAGILSACIPMASTSAPQQPASSPTPGSDSPTNSDTPTAPGPAPYDPRPEDSALTRGSVGIERTDLMSMESFPRQFSLLIKGELPTPCHELRLQVGQPDRDGNIAIEAYSVVDPNAICEQVVQPFEVTLPLGSFPDGQYKVLVNGEAVADFVP